MPSPSSYSSDTSGHAIPCTVLQGAMQCHPLWLPASALRSLWPWLYYVCMVARETLVLNWNQSGGGWNSYFFSLSLTPSFFFFIQIFRALIMSLLKKRQLGMGQWEICSLCNLVRFQLLILPPFCKGWSFLLLLSLRRLKGTSTQDLLSTACSHCTLTEERQASSDPKGV